MVEIWKDIKGYEGIYQVSDLGRVKSLNYNHHGMEAILKPSNRGNGYLFVVLCINKIKTNYLVHRLVCESFLPNPENKRTVNHKNGIKTDNRLDNLEWATHHENNKHAHDNGLNVSPKFWTGKFGSDNPSSIPVCRFSKTGEYIDEFAGASEAARITGLHRGHISDCCRGSLKSHGGYIWKYK